MSYVFMSQSNTTHPPCLRYVVVYQDCRGRYKSEGRFTKYTSEGDDGVDTLSWICAQPWCNGKVTLP